MQYYIFVNGTRLGPYSKEELRLQGITPETIIWRIGLNDWVMASSLPELADLLADSAFGAYAQQEPTPTPPPAQYPDYKAQPGAPVPPAYNAAYNNAPYNQGYNQGYNQPYNNNMPTPHTNWMTWAIVATVVGFCTSCIGGIFGIIAIVNASKANNAYAMGRNDIGDSANSTAKAMVITAIILDILGILGVIAYTAFLVPSFSNLV